MKFILKHICLRPDESLAARVQQKISKLARLAPIEPAEIIIKRSAAGQPPFSVRMHLAVPGPNLHAVGKGYTPEATIQQVLTRLSRQIRHGQQKSLTRRRRNAAEGWHWSKSIPTPSTPTA